MKIGIIGGSGSTGGQFYEILKKDFDVVKIGRKTENYREVTEGQDVLILSVPIDALEETIEKISEFKLEGKIVLNFSSIMSYCYEELKNLKAEVFCVHPMFGPQVKDLMNQNIVVAPSSKDDSGEPEKENETLKKILRVFERQGAEVACSTIEEHDKLMAVIQALSQFSSITLGSTLAHQEIPLNDLLKYSSVTFRMNLGTIERILQQNAELWRNIQFLNPYFKETLEIYEKEVKKMKEFVVKQEKNAFDANFGEIKSRWEGEISKKSENFEKTVLILDPKKDEVGLLLKILQIFEKNNASLTEIQSKKSKTTFGAYMFKVVVDTKDEELLENLKKDLEKIDVNMEIV